MRDAGGALAALRGGPAASGGPVLYPGWLVETPGLLSWFWLAPRVLSLPRPGGAEPLSAFSRVANAAAEAWEESGQVAAGGRGAWKGFVSA